MIRSVSWAVLVSVLVSSVAFADDDDLLAAPTAKKKTPPAKAPAAKAPPAKKAPPPKKSTNAVLDDELAAPMPVKTQVQIKLAREAKKAHLFVDDQDMGPVSSEALSVAPGAHTLAVKAPAHTTWTKKVTLVAGKTLAEVVALEATGGLLNVSSDVLGADVFVNGKSIGTTPVEDAEVAAGNAEVLVKKQGYKDGTSSARIEKGKEASVTVRLVADEAVTSTLVAQNGDRPEATHLTPNPQPVDETTNVVESSKPEPIYTKWYFWAGAVAVVAAVAVGTGVGVSQANQSSSLDEKKICGGKCDACIGFACSGLVSLPIGR